MSGSDQELEAFFKKKKLKSKKKAVVKIDDIGKQLDQHSMEEMNPGVNVVKDFSKPIKELYGIKSSMSTEKVAWKVEIEEQPVEVVPVDLPPAKYVPKYKQAAAPAVLNIKSEKMFPSISEADKLAKELAMAEKIEQEEIYAKKLEEERAEADRLEKAKNAPKKYEAPKRAGFDFMKGTSGDMHQSQADKAPGADSNAWRDPTRQLRESSRPATNAPATPDFWRNAPSEEKIVSLPISDASMPKENWRENARPTNADMILAPSAPEEKNSSWRKNDRLPAVDAIPARVPPKEKKNVYVPPFRKI